LQNGHNSTSPQPIRVKATNFTHLLVAPRGIFCYPDKKEVAVSKWRQAALDVMRNKCKGAGNRVTGEVYADGNCSGLCGINAGVEIPEFPMFQITSSLSS
jgi:hypothetical protein